MSRRVARPYAAALFQVVERQGLSALRDIEEQLATVNQVFIQVPAVLRAFEVPTVPPARKQELLASIGKALKLRAEAQRLLAALAQHYRLRSLGDVVEAFRGLVDRQEGLVRGRAELPVAPSKAQTEALGKALQELLDTRVELTSEVHPELLAGFVIRVGSRVYDGSLRTQIARFARGIAG